MHFSKLFVGSFWANGMKTCFDNLFQSKTLICIFHFHRHAHWILMNFNLWFGRLSNCLESFYNSNMHSNEFFSSLQLSQWKRLLVSPKNLPIAESQKQNQLNQSRSTSPINSDRCAASVFIQKSLLFVAHFFVLLSPSHKHFESSEAVGKSRMFVYLIYLIWKSQSQNFHQI